MVGDGGTSVVQVSKTGELIDSMTLATGSSPQGTEFYDPEGLTYLGGGQFVLSEERDRQFVRFTYVPGTTLTRSAAETVKLGTFAPNIGIEGLTYDPQTAGFIAVKEIAPQGIFQTGVDFAAGTATNGSPTTENSVDLFDPALLNMLDFADVFALSNLPTLSGPESGHLLVLSQESGVDRERRPERQHRQLVDDRQRPGQSAVGRRPAARRAHDGQRRLPVRRQREWRRRFRSSAALGLRTVIRAEPGADEPVAGESAELDCREHEHCRAAQGGRRGGHR